MSTEHQLVVGAFRTDDALQATLDEWAADGWTLLAHAVLHSKHWLTFGRSSAANSA